MDSFLRSAESSMLMSSRQILSGCVRSPTQFPLAFQWAPQLVAELGRCTAGEVAECIQATKLRISLWSLLQS